MTWIFVHGSFVDSPMAAPCHRLAFWNAVVMILSVILLLDQLLVSEQKKQIHYCLFFRGGRGNNQVNHWRWFSQPCFLLAGAPKASERLCLPITGRPSQLQGDEQSSCPNKSKLTNAVPVAVQLPLSDAPLQVQRRLETASQVLIINEPVYACVSRLLSPPSPRVLGSGIGRWQNQSPRLRHREECRGGVYHRSRGWRQHVRHHNQRAHSRGRHYPQKGTEF